MTAAATSSAAGTIRNAIKAHPAVRSCTMPHSMRNTDITLAFMVSMLDGSKFFVAVTEVENDD